mmetsp:Transcript_26683/g.45978  ORF Transcript_26683/g.45978 Transcript_26683/m.45978 type:complete len:777 (-) Transcript_26683:419-2749(-)|eukprot:CAMPEP_0196652096 /NCGR_PEP_ID=MMETSP1086-20130531/1323_1 /TAXON_ID=77921 /ORGANISM="Cyanoptyche  gloeocystis , Strain SAG4.97" /LENGTH=776 /DNA_ID=CAMNT_0041982471 /DNA_START=138 /DNA_END=2468 /DNA_ORIENTATION=-
MAPRHPEQVSEHPTSETLVPSKVLQHSEYYFAPLKCYKNRNPEPLPKEVTLDRIIKSMPQEVFQVNNAKAAKSVVVSFLSTGLAILMLYFLPWYLLPLGWVLAGTAATGLFVVGHDCGHRSFSKSKMVNDIVGTICFAPLVYPYESWRIKHDHHHKNTNRLEIDNAWQPIQEREWADYGVIMRLFMRLIKGPMWWFASVGHWVKEHFFLSTFEEKDHKRVKISIAVVYLFMATVWPALIYFTGFSGFFKLWLMPWLGYHFWMSTFTMIHHTLPQLPFLSEEEWNDAVARLTLTVHCDYPRWIEFLCHDINVHVPHHVSTAIPHYNLRMAWAALKKNWGKHLHECSFSWELLRDVTSKCHIYDKRINYRSFEEVAQAKAKGPLYSRLNWLHTPLLIGTPLLAIYGVYNWDFNVKTLVWAVVYYFITGLGITAGYHRLWAHKAYKARLPMKLALLLGGTGAFEGSIRWWCRDHRAHHRYTDTERDPYNAKEGFFYSHLGWMLLKQDPTKIGKADISDLNSDSMIRWQHRNYYWFAPLMAFIFPMLVAGLGWGDYWGGYFVAGVARLVFVHHATFFVNSLAHTLGAATFADKHTPRDSFITALLTLGEGYHNFHHEFPQDFRNAIRFYQYDPTKWLISFCAFFGLVYDRVVFPENEVKKGVVQMEQKRLDRLKENLRWPQEVEQLPVMTWEELRAQSRSYAPEGADLSKLRHLVVFEGVVHDVTDFVPTHPGGTKILEPFLGKDITKAFNGEVYEHSNGAHNLLGTMRVARLADDKKRL